MSPATAAVVSEALEVCRVTDGAYDITIAPLLKLWSFGADAGLRQIPGPEAISEARELMGFERGEGAPERRMRAVGRFAEGEEDGVRLVQLRAHAALGPHAAFGTIVVAKDEDREWALETWSSLLHVDER